MRFLGKSQIQRKRATSNWLLGKKAKLKRMGKVMMRAKTAKLIPVMDVVSRLHTICYSTWHTSQICMIVAWSANCELL